MNSINTTRDTIHYLDNIKIFLTILVLSFHVSSGYGGVGGWYYIEGTPDSGAGAVLTMFNAVCQSFFMGLFFFISAYFVPGSYDRRGFASYVNDRILRLLVPALFFCLVLNPLSVNLVRSKDYLASLGFYNLWFVMALFLFSMAYALIRRGVAVPLGPLSFPGRKTIWLFIAGMGVFNFLTRLLFPIDRMYFFDFTLGYFPQYIILFPLGIVAYRNNWLANIDVTTTTIFFRVSCIAALLLPGIFFGATALHGDITRFYGGFTVESLIYSLWEPCMYVGIILKILHYFKVKANGTNPILLRISRYGYAIFIVHSPIVVLLQLWLAAVDVNVLWKVLVVIPLTYMLSVALSHALLKIPVIDRVL